jgi:hypothetical protein
MIFSNLANGFENNASDKKAKKALPVLRKDCGMIP